MADSDKQILITPNISQTAQPEIKFVGKDNSPLYIKVLDDNSLSFEGTEGQVFSISPTMSSGDIFSVNDISGIQSIAVNADGNITMDAQSQSTTIKNNASNTATLILENTNADAIDGPMLEFYRNTPSPADGDDTGAIVWTMQTDAGNKHEFGRIVMEYSDASDGSEDGELIFKLTEASANEQEYMRFRGSSRQIEFNASQDDIDLCYNSDATADFFYINANTQRIGVGDAGTAPSHLVHIEGIDGGNGELFVERASGAGILLQAQSATGKIGTNTNHDLAFMTNGSTRMHIENDGDVGIGTTSPAFKLDVAGYIATTDGFVHTGDTNNTITFGTDTQSFNTGSTARMNISDSGLQIGTGARVTTILDEDAMGSNSATALATQQSIKAYVDANAGGSGDITAVVAGTGLSGGATSGSATLNVDLKDEDDMSSNSATHAASQQSIKAYVDNQSPGTADFLIMEANTGAVDHSNDAGTLYNVNNTSYQFICFKNEQKKDAIYTHSTSSSSEEVTVTEAGTYMIFYSVRTDNLDDNRFIAEAAIHHQPSGGSYAERDYTRATSYSRGSGGTGVYDFDIQLNFAGALVLGAGDKIKLGVKQNDADDSSNTVRVQTDGTMLTMVRVAKTGNKASIIAATGATTLTNAQSGSVVYITGSGSVTLPASIEKGVQFVIINDTGSNETPGLNSNTHILGTHGAMATNTARTYVAVSDGNVAAIG